MVWYGMVCPPYEHMVTKQTNKESVRMGENLDRIKRAPQYQYARETVLTAVV